MDTGDLVKIEIEHLTGQMLLEINLELRASDLKIHVTGRDLTWTANGVRVTIPATAAEALSAAIAHVIKNGDQGRPAEPTRAPSS